MKRSILFLLSFCMLLSTCSDADDPVKEIEKPPVEVDKKDPFITPKKTNVDFTNKGGSETISIESNVSWTAESSASWCTVSPSSGSNSTTSITLTVAANEDYDNRSCTVTIESGNTSKTITVKQGENLGLLISQDRYELGYEESTITVEVRANVEFDVEVPDKWITRVDTRGLTTSELTFKVAENDTHDNREGSITIKQKDGDLSSTITILQSQEDAIILSQKIYDLSFENQTIEVELKTNVDFEVIIPEEAQSWVLYVATRALRTEVLSLKIDKNTSNDARYTEVYVKDKETNLQDTLTINQVGKELGVYYVEAMGTLGSMLSQTQRDTITTMIIKGEINKVDFDVMKNEIPNLRHLDLKDVKCDGDKIPDEAFGNYFDVDDEDNEEEDFISNKTLETIILPQNITSIGNWAFSGCIGLTGSLNLPDGLTTIGDFAFALCEDLTGPLKLPNRLTKIGKGAFAGCSGFTGSLNIPDGITIIEFAAFSGCSGFTGSLTLPDGLKTIESLAFVDCSGFTGNLNLPEGLTTIGSESFQYCRGFTGSLKIPKGVAEIGGYAFFYCDGFDGSLDLPDGLRTIGLYAFHDCSGLKGSLIIPEGVTEIGGKAFFNCSGFNGTLGLPNSLTTIEYATFTNCSGFTGHLNLPDGIKTIEARAFSGCESFSGLTLPYPNNLTMIGSNAFSYCKGFTGIFPTPTRAEYIGVESFKGCTGFEDIVVLPRRLKYLGRDAFIDCEKVVAFRLHSTEPPFIHDNHYDWEDYYYHYESHPVFPVNATIVVYNNNSVATYKATNGWKNYNIVGYNPDGTIVKNKYVVNPMGSLGGMLNQTQKDTITTMIIRGEINKADFDVMKNEIRNLRYLDLKDVKCDGDKIPDEAFGDAENSNKKIKTIILPEQISSIGNYAFYQCTGLSGFFEYSRWSNNN